jgi:hypothetical protein
MERELLLLPPPPLLLLLFFVRECLNLVDAFIAFFLRLPILFHLSSSELSEFSLLSSLPNNQ